MTSRSLRGGLTYCRTSDLQSAKILAREVTIVLEKGLNLQAWCSWICGRISLMSKHQTFDLGGFTIHFAGRMMPRDDGSLVSFQVGRMDFKIHDLGCITCCLNLGSAGLKLGLASWLKLISTTSGLGFGPTACRNACINVHAHTTRRPSDILTHLWLLCLKPWFQSHFNNLRLMCSRIHRHLDSQASTFSTFTLNYHLYHHHNHLWHHYHHLNHHLNHLTFGLGFLRSWVINLGA